jgi:hypothetical protein
MSLSEMAEVTILVIVVFSVPLSSQSLMLGHFKFLTSVNLAGDGFPTALMRVPIIICIIHSFLG